MKRLLSTLVLAAVAMSVQASTCYRFYNFNSTYGQNGIYFDSADAWNEAAMAYQLASGSPFFVQHYEADGCTAHVPPATYVVCSWHNYRVPKAGSSCSTSGGTVNCSNPFNSGTINVSAELNPDGCPDCEYDGMKNWGVSVDGPYPDGGYCEGDCRVTASQQSCSGPPELRTCTAMLSYQNENNCAGGGSEPSGNTAETPQEEPPTDESCIAVGDGEFCATPNGDGECGYMNDSYICLSKVKQDECAVLGDGGRVCGAGAVTTPPAPDSGTPGELATADGELAAITPTGGGGSSTTNYNYFNGSTMAASSRDPGTTGAAPSGGSPNGGDGSGGDGDAPECVGTTCGEGVPELEDIGTMGDAFGQFWEDLQEVPLVEAAQDVAPSFGSGSCPVWSDTFEVGGETVEADFSFICTTWEDVTPVLSIVALVLWGLMAFRILFTA